jgi:hypothetical protein
MASMKHFSRQNRRRPSELTAKEKPPNQAA